MLVKTQYYTKTLCVCDDHRDCRHRVVIWKVARVAGKVQAYRERVGFV